MNFSHRAAASQKVAVVTRSYDIARTGANTRETMLTPRRVGDGFLTKYFSLTFNDDPRLEAQPLYVPDLTMKDGKVHDVVYVCTMANNIWAFDANDGTPIWKRPVNLGPPIQPAPKPRRGFPTATVLDHFGINILWGILSTPVIDLDTNRMYVVNWTSPDRSIRRSLFQLSAVDITSGQKISSLRVKARGDSQVAPGTPVPQFIAKKQKQRASLLLVTPDNSKIARKTLFLACGMLHEEGDPTHGWVIAYDVDTFRQTAAWCTTPNGTGSGIWHAGQGPSADENGDIYVITGNYGVQDANEHSVTPAAGDLPESIVKLQYTAPADSTSQGKLGAVAWFTPFQDAMRTTNGIHDFQDYDLGSGGPVPIPGMSMVVGAGKDGVLYVLDQDTAGFGQGSDFSKLKQPPVFFTYDPGPGIDASNLANLDKFYDGKTHHLHGTPVFWLSPTKGPMLFVWGENESLRAYSLNASGKVTLLAKSAEIASPKSGGIGGMPGGFPVISSNSSKPNTGIIWATAPRFGDAYRYVVEGILRAYDATKLDPVPNADGSPRLKLLWDSTHIPDNKFTHSKFCPPVVADGKVFVATYSGRVDVYGLEEQIVGPLPTNAEEMPDS
jgi:outer membrane protein assembly factor BamB